MKYAALSLFLLAPIWLLKPLWAEQFLVDESVNYLEDNAHCIAIFAATEDDALRSQLELEVDDEYYSSEAVEQRMEKFIKFLGKKLATPLGELISEVELNDIFLKMDEIVGRESFYIKNAFDSNGAQFFDQLYLECVKQFHFAIQ